MLQPQQQLDSLEAAEADLAIEGGVGRGRPPRAISARFPGQVADHVEHALEDVLEGRLRPGRGGTLGHGPL